MKMGSKNSEKIWQITNECVECPCIFGFQTVKVKFQIPSKPSNLSQIRIFLKQKFSKRLKIWFNTSWRVLGQEFYKIIVPHWTKKLKHQFKTIWWNLFQTHPNSKFWNCPQFNHDVYALLMTCLECLCKVGRDKSPPNKISSWDLERGKLEKWVNAMRYSQEFKVRQKGNLKLQLKLEIKEYSPTQGGHIHLDKKQGTKSFEIFDGDCVHI